MNVGLLPAMGSGLRDLARTGQSARLIEGYVRPYARAFERLFYFSYVPETLGEFIDDAELRSRVEVLAPSRPMARSYRAVTMVSAHAAQFRSCAVLRVFQLTGVVPALIARARFGIPYVTTYGFSYARLSRAGASRLAKRVLERVGLRRAAAVIVTTEELKRHVARLVPAARTHLIPNGVDTARFVPAPRATRRREDHVDAALGRGGRRRILYVGRLEPEKNLGALVEAAATVNRRVPVELRLIGTGSQGPALPLRVPESGLPLTLTGVVRHEDLPVQYAGADVFVLPSFTEGHPKVLLEAMACGVPCVVSNCDGNRALVTDGETGLLFDPRDPRALAHAVTRVLTNDTLAGGLGSRARELVVRRYDLAALVAREIDLVRSVAASAAAQRGAQAGGQSARGSAAPPGE